MNTFGELAGLAAQCVSDISAHKQMATSFQSPQLNEFPRKVSDKTAFNELVVAIYIWTCETFRTDLEFLRRRSGKAAELQEFVQSVTSLRHAHLHPDADEHKHRSEEWMRRVEESAPLEIADSIPFSSALMEQFIEFLLAVREAASAARADPRACMDWREHVQTTPRIQMKLAYEDLGQKPRGGQFDYHVRQFERNTRRKNLNKSKAQDLAGTIAVAASLGHLPVHYQTVLVELDLVGDQASVSALLIAHGLAARGTLTGDAFLDAVREAVPAVWALELKYTHRT